MTSISKFNTGSELSIGFVDRSDSNSTCLKKVPVNVPQHVNVDKEEVLENVCCLVLYCQSHKRVAIKRNFNKGLFLPYITFRPNDSWKHVSNYLVKTTLDRIASSNVNVSSTHCELIDIFRVQLPKTRQFYTRITILTRLINNLPSKSSFLRQSSEQSNQIQNLSSKLKDEHVKSIQSTPLSFECCCSISTNLLLWMGIDDLNNTFNNKFWGPEALLFYYSIQETDIEKYEMKKNYSDYSIKDSLKYLMKNTGREKKLLEEAKYTKCTILKLFNEYVTHCYPSRYMTYNSFKVFMNKISWHTEEVIFQMLFKALNYRNTNFLSFEELLLGFAVMDITTPHSGTILEQRFEYIFRFYDSDLDNLLSLAEFVRMTNDIIIKNQDSSIVKTNSAGDVAKKMITIFTNSVDHLKITNKDSTKVGLSLEQFLAIMVTHKTFCELTSEIFRAPFCLQLYITTKFNYDPNSTYTDLSLLQLCTLTIKNPKLCLICRRTKFHISTHCLKVNDVGEIVDVVNLEVLQLQEKEKTPFMLEIKSTDCVILANDIINRITRLGLDIFYQSSNEKSLKSNLDDKSLIKHWYFVNRSQHIEAMKKILLKAKDLISTETKFVSIKSPCYVISGLYGNLKDLLNFSHLLWKSSPFINKATYIFLGNLIDYQPWSIECIIYLLCMKIIAPNRFIILRGFNEVRDNQKSTNFFYHECCRDYKQEFWNLINEVFDQLPLGAVIEDKIFCSSSAFPRSKKSLSGLNLCLPSSLSNPLENDSVKEILTREYFDNPNSNEKDFRRFCDMNRLSSMIRSHTLPASTPTSLQQVCSNKFYFNYDVISLFTGSNLQNISENITSSVALVTRDFIRIIRVETFLKTWSSIATNYEHPTNTN